MTAENEGDDTARVTGTPRQPLSRTTGGPLVPMSSIARAVLAFGGGAILVGACAVDIGQETHPPMPATSLGPPIDATLGTPAIGQPSPASPTDAPPVSGLPSPTAAVTPQPSPSSLRSAPGPVIDVAAHDRFWNPFVDFGPPIGLPFGLTTVADATGLADLVIRGSITDLYIGEQWIGAPDEPAMPFGYVRVQIHEVLKGEPVSRSDGAVEVQFAWGHSESDFELIASEPMPAGEYVWFLIHEATFREENGQPPRNTGIAPFAYFIPNEVQGVVLNASGLAEVVLADRFVNIWGTERFPMTIRGQSFEAMVDEVRELVRRVP